MISSEQPRFRFLRICCRSGPALAGRAGSESGRRCTRPGRSGPRQSGSLFRGAARSAPSRSKHAAPPGEGASSSAGGRSATRPVPVKSIASGRAGSRAEQRPVGDREAGVSVGRNRVSEPAASGDRAGRSAGWRHQFGFAAVLEDEQRMVVPSASRNSAERKKSGPLAARPHRRPVPWRASTEPQATLTTSRLRRRTVPAAPSSPVKHEFAVRPPDVAGHVALIGQPCAVIDLLRGFVEGRDATIDPVGAELLESLGHGQPFGPAADPCPAPRHRSGQPSSRGLAKSRIAR